MVTIPRKTKDELIKEYLRSKGNLSRFTLENYTYHISSFFQDSPMPDKITPQFIDRHLTKLPVSLQTKKDRYCVLSVFWTWMKRRHYVKSDYFKDGLINKPKPEIKVLSSLTTAQIKTLLDEAPSLRVGLLVSLLADTGGRISDLVSIKRKNIKLEDREIRVLGKGRKYRDIYFGDFTAKLLDEYLKLTAGQRFRYANIWNVKDRHGLSGSLRRLGDKTGIHCNPHAFRRTFAILCREKGMTHLAIMDLGGWDSLSMVLKYTRGYDKKKSKRFYKPVVDFFEVPGSADPEPVPAIPEPIAPKKRRKTRKLTAIEMKVLEFMHNGDVGKRYQNVVAKFGIPRYKVEQIASSIYKKLHVRGKAEAVYQAINLGIIKV